MKLLLDENLPKRLKLDFPEHEIFPVSDKGWNGKKNGEPRQLLLTERFDGLLAFDKNLQFQQNFKKYAVPFFALNAPGNTYTTLKTLVPAIRETLRDPLKAGSTIINA
ncbi:hypothetical protein [Rufibacter sp. XAAS-G3-1]|uniref:hypothetical protein n=1 Tax=Rufibacter sp. XAAS-G3-1 TaxID=2729134 RepID=UPI0015E78D12|nr:hypothetical protein [Rufibacter sp. XAAS-G3-1]